MTLKMRTHRLAVALAVVIFVLAPSLALGQEANAGIDGSALVRRAVLDKLITNCSDRLPKRKAGWEADFAAWKRERADRLQVADAALLSLSTEQRHAFQTAVEPSLNTVGILLDQADKEGKLAEFCGHAIPEFSNDKESRYLDADNFDEAVGMYAQNRLAIATLSPLCVSAFPEIKEELAAGTTKWLEIDRSILSKVDSEAAAMRRSNPEMLAAMETQVRQAARSAFDAVSKMGPDTARMYCLKQVTDLADGTRRSQTPKMYEFLERGQSK